LTIRPLRLTFAASHPAAAVTQSRFTFMLRTAVTRLKSQDYFVFWNNLVYPQKPATPPLPSRGKPTIRFAAVTVTVMA
jgi:hypothetical protein